MFPSGGYFRSANCPFFVHGLCHRPYCHFRHSKPEYKPTSISTSSVANEPIRSGKSENSKSAKAECLENKPRDRKKSKICAEDRKIKVKAGDDVKHGPHDKQESVPPPANPLFKRTALEEKLIAISANTEETFSESDSDCSETSQNNVGNNSGKTDDKVVNESVKKDIPNKTRTGIVASVAKEVRSAGEEVKQVGEEIKPVGEDVKPVGEEVKPVGEDAKPVGEEVKPVGEEVKPVGEEVKPVGEEIKSVGEEVKPVDEEVKPVGEGVMPVVECVMPVGEEEASPIAEEVRSVVESIRNRTVDCNNDSATKSSDDKVKTKKAVVEYLPRGNVTALVSDNLEIANKDEMTNNAKNIARNEDSLDLLIGDLQKYGKGVQNIERKKVEIRDETDCVKETCVPETPQLTDVNFFSSIVVKRSSGKKKKSLSKAAGLSSRSKRDAKNTEADDKGKISKGLSSGRKKVAKNTEVDDKEKISTENKKNKKKKTKKSSDAKASSTKEKTKIQRYKELKKLVKDSAESLVSVADSSRKECDKREKTKNIQTILIDSDSDRIRGDMEEDIEENELLKIFNDYEPSEELDYMNEAEDCLVKYNQNNGQSSGVGSSAQLRGIKRPPTEKVAITFKKQRVAHQPNISSQRPAIPSRNSSSTFRRLPRPLVGTLLPSSQATKRQTQPQGDKDLVTTTHVKQRVTHYAKSAGTTYIRPRVRLEYGAKVPQNTRQKYLDKLVDEYLCIYQDQQEAFDKAEKEEKAIYIKSPRRQVYINVCVNHIKKLRDGDEQPESDECKVGKRNPLAAKSSLPSPQRRLSIDTSLTSVPEYIQPQETIVNVVKKTGNVDDEITEEMFYTRLKKHLLSEDELVANGFPRASNIPGRAEINNCYGKLQKKCSDPTRYICCRCGKPFVILESGEYQNKEECVHHHGRLLRRRTGGDISSSYSCCQGEAGCMGCSVAKAHVKEIDWSEEDGFMKTIPCPFSSSETIYALDCEMCYTTKGLELTRVTVVNYKRQQVYDTLVKPDNAIIDYNTRFSGITEECMIGIKTTLPDVQAILLSMIHEDTILLGHSLESDLKSLKLIHSTVVDTSVVFPHRLGPPYKRALRTLMGEFVRKIIQDSEEGHDSLEDAVSCVELMLWKIKEDMKLKEKNKKQ